MLLFTLNQRSNAIAVIIVFSKHQPTTAIIDIYRLLMKLFDYTWISSKRQVPYFCLVTLFFLSLPNISNSQTGSATQLNDSTLIDVAKIRLQQIFYKEIFFTLADHNQVKDEDILSLPFKPIKFYKNKVGVPPSFIEKEIFLRFAVFNSADSTQSVYFMPARFCKNVRMYTASPVDIRETFREIPDSVSHTSEYRGYHTLVVEPKDTVIFYARFNFLRANVNAFSPRFTEVGYEPQSVRELKFRDPMLSMISYIATGILLLMIFYSLAAYIQYLNIEFIYYSAYACCSGLLLFSKAYLSMDHSAFNFFYEEYLDFIILCAGAFFYLIFVRNFLNSKVLYPRLDKFLRIARIILVFLLAIFSAIYFFTDRYVTLLILENYVIKVFLCLIGIVFIVYSLRRKSTLLKYLAAGNICLIFFSILSRSTQSAGLSSSDFDLPISESASSSVGKASDGAESNDATPTIEPVWRNLRRLKEVMADRFRWMYLNLSIIFERSAVSR